MSKLTKEQKIEIHERRLRREPFQKLTLKFDKNLSKRLNESYRKGFFYFKRNLE